MLGLTLLTLATAACVSGVKSRRELREISKRQAPSLPSDQSYINATRNDRSAVTLQIGTNDTSARNATSPYLYGIMFEDINHRYEQRGMLQSVFTHTYLAATVAYTPR